jgi:hypothetical protein
MIWLVQGGQLYVLILPLQEGFPESSIHFDRQSWLGADIISRAAGYWNVKQTGGYHDSCSHVSRVLQGVAVGYLLPNSSIVRTVSVGSVVCASVEGINLWTML